MTIIYLCARVQLGNACDINNVATGWSEHGYAAVAWSVIVLTVEVIVECTRPPSWSAVPTAVPLQRQLDGSKLITCLHNTTQVRLPTDQIRVPDSL